MRSCRECDAIGVKLAGGKTMARNVVRSILGILLAAAAAWLANYLIEKLFGPEESDLANV
jgi:hypothetical protein